jgi:hypothetical protein
VDGSVTGGTLVTITAFGVQNLPSLDATRVFMTADGVASVITSAVQSVTAVETPVISQLTVVLAMPPHSTPGTPVHLLTRPSQVTNHTFKVEAPPF